MEKALYFKCTKCGKEIVTNEDYNKETQDVPYGFEWVVEHKQEFCKNTQG